MKQLAIDLEELCTALEDHGGNQWYLDVETGAMFPDCPDFLDEVPELARKLEEDSDEVHCIQPVSSRTGFEFMEEFVASLAEGEAQRSLARALRLRKPFGSFRDTLCGFPAEREAWFVFHRERLQSIARAFLKELGIEPLAGSLDSPD